MRSWWLAITLCACGDVNNAGPAIPDAYAPDAPVELGCSEGESECSGTCANLMTDDLHCGSCNNHCSPLQGCLDGNCVDKASRCTSIRLWDPQAKDGLYFNPNLGVPVYCDFTNGITYEDFRFNPYTVTPSGYSLARATNFQNAQFADAFIGFYNYYKGVRASSTFDIGNCCITTVAGSRLTAGGALTFPGIGTQNGCTFSMTANAVYTISRNQSTGYSEMLPENFFTVNPPGEMASCADSTNPAIYFKRRFGLN